MKSTRNNLLTESEMRNPAKNIFSTLEVMHQVGYHHGDVRP